MSVLLACAMLLGACGRSSEHPPPSVPGPTGTSAPSAAPATADAGLAVVGKAQTVFDWSTDRCDDNDIPDLPARAFRDVTGRVQVIATHYDNRRFVGTSLDVIRRQCPYVMRSRQNADPATFADHEWLASPYTMDGRTIYALVHDEYHGHEHAGQCPQRDYFPCWYNAVTLAVSADAGATYRPVGDPSLVAALPRRYEAGAGPYGVFEPSNIIKGKDGLLYAFVDPGHLGVMGSTVTFNTYLDRYVMVGATAVDVGGREAWGIAYAFSTDLLAWTTRRLLLEVELPWTYRPGDGNVYLYPSLLDSASPSRTFDATGKVAYLYLTRFNTGSGGMTLDRDLVRLPVEFYPSAQEAAAAGVPFQP